MIPYFQSLLKTINESINNVNEQEFNAIVSDCVKVLKNGGKIIATGLGKNVPICEKFEGTMLSLGLNAKFLHTNTAVHGDLGAVQDGDLIMVLSKSGETAESLYLLNELKKRDTIIWAMTFKSESSLATNANNKFVIEMDSEGDLWDIVPNNSTTLYLIVLQAIAIEVSKKMNVTLSDFKRNHPGGHIGVQLNDKC